MATIVIKNVSDKHHKQLKKQAMDNHRSMGQEALTALEIGLKFTEKRKLPRPVRGKFLLTNEWINRAKREGRA
jgi:plasmid stability protein